jgi:hypothetical protein
VKDNITRRAVIKGGFMAGAMLPGLGLIAGAAAGANLPPLDPKSPAAVTLGFVNDASKVDAAANPTYVPGATCENCQQYQGKPGDGRGVCVLFADATVPAQGWCKVWRKKV